MSDRFMKPRLRTLLVFVAFFALLFAITAGGLRYQLNSVREYFFYHCFTISQDKFRGCLTQHYDTITETAGIAVALAEVKERIDHSPQLKRSCHQILHTIGRAAARSGKSVGELFTSGDPICWSGYYHGVMEGALRGVQPKDITQIFMENLCASTEGSNKNLFDRYNCIHGAGHGLMYLSHNDLPLSLSQCALLSNPDDIQNCSGGVFMENLVAAQSDHDTQYVREDEPLYPCTTLAGSPVEEICYSTQAGEVWLKYPHPSDAERICKSIPNASGTNACIEGIGREIAAASMNVAESTLTQCMHLSTSSLQRICIGGAVKNFIAYYHDDQEALHLCEIIGNPEEASSCNTLVKEFSGIMSPQR